MNKTFKMKILKTINVDYISNRHAKDIIQEYTSQGWGIDAMVEDSNRDTWITFYRYKDKPSIVIPDPMPEKQHI